MSGAASPTMPSVAAEPPRAPASPYLTVLGTAFALFGTLRIVSYLPTLVAIVASGDSSQHSLWTWGIWFGSHLTMAAWLYEQGGRRIDRAIGLSLCNAVMCAAALGLIVFYRVVALGAGT